MSAIYNKLLNKHVLILGGTSGIGFGVAKASLASSARVTVSSSSVDRVSSAVTKLTGEFPGAQVQGYACDLGGENVEEEIESLFEKVGSVDHIVFTVGEKPLAMPLADITREKILAPAQIRLVAPILVAKVGSKYLSAGPESSITLTTGQAWERPAPDWTIMSGYLGAYYSLTRNLALDMKPVRVNAVSPAIVETEMWDGMPKEQKEGIFQFMASKYPTGRVTKPETLAEAYLYLMKDSNITGRVVGSDSGASLV
ncbi:hypothetical protein EYZ11_009519 [Aspergillus tanneri]|uniref:Uncharacterized protein n=1 Tax=Aspergillus tanneri TaxID=1220188 RepID=A0A4S3JD30_9EURO|nr:uncharacterized protein ATNIH1004_010268 [Aspergillus tanneri]KAA8643499.1 hypothetical protein ATNIH1004_010268 [Aspergillus tanneri]THC91011.1 hypothetical protein EYZ11_009519 [Aspergillus tanneri]